jgi:hypothetical protein
MQELGRLSGTKMPSFSVDPNCIAARRAADRCYRMPDRNYRTTVGRLIWRLGVAIVLALQLLAALAVGRKFYMVQEVFVVMLLIAIAVAALLLLLVAIVLFQEGIRRPALWMKTGLLRIVKLSHRQVSPPEPLSPPALRR